MTTPPSRRPGVNKGGEEAEQQVRNEIRTILQLHTCWEETYTILPEKVLEGVLKILAASS